MKRVSEAIDPVTLKGTREPVLLVATGAFLSAFQVPLVIVIAGAGLGLGTHDLLLSETRSRSRMWLRGAAITGWAACVFAASSFVLPGFAGLAFVSLAMALYSSATALGRISDEVGRFELARRFAIVRYVQLAFLPMALLDLPRAAILVQVLGCLALSALTLHMRSLALPCGQRSGAP